MDTLLEISKFAESMLMNSGVLSLKIKYHLEDIESLQDSPDGLLKQVQLMIDSLGFSFKVRRYI